MNGMHAYNGFKKSRIFKNPSANKNKHELSKKTSKATKAAISTYLSSLEAQSKFSSAIQ